jgi:hypothetical protein
MVQPMMNLRPSSQRFSPLTVTIAAAMLCASLGGLSGSAAAVDAQLAPNPGLEVAATSTAPANWSSVKSGSNKTKFSYPTTGAHTGSRFVRSEITALSSGNVRWAHTMVPVASSSAYTYSGWYRSNVATELFVQYQSTAGTITTAQLTSVPASAAWAQTSAAFTPPSGTSSARVYHRLSRVGWLDVDDVSITKDAPPTSSTGRALYVSTTGSDAAPGTVDAPLRSIAAGMKALRAGDTLYVRGGRYAERIQNPPVAAGTATSPITVAAYPGEEPVIEGLLWLSGLTYWTLNNIDVTWSSVNAASEHMVKFSSGSNWRYTGSEVWGARSYAGILVAGTPNSWRLDRLYVHDTYASNSVNQDHLIYVNTTAGAGIIERSLFTNSPNGRGVKVGPASGSTTPIGNVTIRYNTFHNNTGPSNIQLSYGAANNAIYRNILSKPASGRSAITAHNLTGTGNIAYDNIAWETAAVIDVNAQLTDGGGNKLVNPMFDARFAPQNTAARSYGHLAT